MECNSLLSAEEINEALERAVLYQMLSIAFYPPKPEAQEFWSKVLSKFADGEKSGSIPVDYIDLSVEYNRLFVGPGKLPCPPYESVYRTDRDAGEIGTLMGPSVWDVKNRYAEAGLEISKDFRDYPDHVAVELEFMHFLCSREATAALSEDKENWRRREKEFLEIHLKSWAGVFSDKVLKSTDSQFYKTAASFLKEHIDDELAYFAE